VSSWPPIFSHVHLPITKYQKMQKVLSLLSSGSPPESLKLIYFFVIVSASTAAFSSF
jgi:hypothetical protein